MKLSKHLGGGKLGLRCYYFRFQQIRIAGTSGGMQPAQSGSWNYEKSANRLLNCMCYIFQRWARIRTGSDCNFFGSWRIGTGSDWEKFCCF